ncbi:MAG: hypothetical protein RR708_04095 [Bacilli bacterium]
MKKTIILLLLLFIVPVKAETYYSEYTDFSEYQDEEIKEDNLTLVEKVELYKAYKENISYEYHDAEENFNGLFTGNQTSKIVGWTLTKPKYFVDEQYIYHYRKLLKNRYLEFKITTYYPLKITLNGSTFVITPKTPLIYKIPDNISLKELKIEANASVSLLPLPNKGVDVTLKSRDKTLNLTRIVDRGNYILGDNNEANDLFEDEITKTESRSEVKGPVLGTEKLYLRQKIYFQYEVRKNNYEDFYLKEETIDFKIDKEKKKNQYRFKTRKDVTIEDNIILKDYKDDPLDFVKSDLEVTYTSNLDKLVNGKYVINFITPFKVIKKDIIVDIKENYVNLIKEQNKVLNDLYEENLKSNFLIDKKNYEIKEILNNSNEEYIEEEYQKCKTSLKEVTLTKKELKEPKKIKTKKMSSIIIVVFITLSYIIALFCRKKSNE